MIGVYGAFVVWTVIETVVEFWWIAIPGGLFWYEVIKFFVEG
jgi:hypothetical protein